MFFYCPLCYIELVDIHISYNDIWRVKCRDCMFEMISCNNDISAPELGMIEQVVFSFSKFRNSLDQKHYVINYLFKYELTQIITDGHVTEFNGIIAFEFSDHKKFIDQLECLLVFN